MIRERINFSSRASGAFAGRLLGCLNSLKDAHDRFKAGISTLLFSGLRLLEVRQNIGNGVE